MFSTVFYPSPISLVLHTFRRRFPVSSSLVLSFLVFLPLSFPPSSLLIPFAEVSRSSVRALPNSSVYPLLFLLTSSFPAPFPALLHLFYVLSILLSVFFHSHISNASNLVISSFCSVHVFDPYNTTLYIKVFTSRFFRLSFIFPRRSSLFLLNASFSSIIRLLISLWLLQSSVMVLPR